jgi:hypothetical protein
MRYRVDRMDATGNVDHGNPDDDVRRVFVTKRDTTTTYTGAVSSHPNKTIELSAVLVDASGKPLAGRTIDFQLGDQSASAVTNADGVASTTLRLNQHKGPSPRPRPGRRTRPTTPATWAPRRT